MKLIKCTLFALLVLCALPSMAADNQMTIDEALQQQADNARAKAVAKEEAKAQGKICEIMGNDCQKVADLLYEIFIWKDAFDIDMDSFFKGKSPCSRAIVDKKYAKKLKKMNIHEICFSRRRDGGTTDLSFADGSKLRFPAFGRGTPIVFQNDQTFSLEWPVEEE